MDFLDFKVAFRGCESLLPLFFGSAEVPAPREVLGKGELGENEVEALLALRVRNESSVREITEVFANPDTEVVYGAVELLLAHLSKLPYFA